MNMKASAYSRQVDRLVGSDRFCDLEHFICNALWSWAAVGHVVLDAKVGFGFVLSVLNWAKVIKNTDRLDRQGYERL